jgi:hypothetical protein
VVEEADEATRRLRNLVHLVVRVDDLQCEACKQGVIMHGELPFTA